MSTCPTVRIASSVPGIPFFVINEVDFDAERHALHDPQAEAKAAAEAQAAMDAAETTEAVEAVAAAAKEYAEAKPATKPATKPAKGSKA